MNHLQGNIDEAIAEDQDCHIRHDATDVVQTKCPFVSDEAKLIFSKAIHTAKDEGIIPKHLGVAEDEWQERFYGETENVKIGRKEVQIVLPFLIWFPRAVAWAQGLELMVRIQAAENNEI